MPLIKSLNDLTNEEYFKVRISSTKKSIREIKKTIKIFEKHDAELQIQILKIMYKYRHCVDVMPNT